jgi:hypothetical protein
MKTVCLLAVAFSTLFLCAAQKTVTYVTHYLEPFHGAQAYKDRLSGTILYLESDGRHVAAISLEGKVLWNRDPFSDAHLEYYRTDKPQIIYIGPAMANDYPKKWKRREIARIVFNNSQFGGLRISDGEFQFLGQD